MASHILSKLAAVIAGSAAALFATAALAGAPCNGPNCGGAWVSASPGYEFGGQASYGQASYGGQVAYSGQAAYGQSYGYAYPAPQDFAAAKVVPADAFFSKDLGEFILPYDAVRAAGDGDALLMEFLQSTYAAAADLAQWNRKALECALGEPGKVRAV